MDGRSGAAIIDCLQYCNYSEEIFRDLRAAGIDAIHATICYHEDFRETLANIDQWNLWFETYPDLIFAGRTADDVRRAKAEGRTAVFFGLQNCSPIEGDVGLIKVLHTLGVRFMQLSYNRQSPLATGCYETSDRGITSMGREVIAEMNRVGMVVDMSHSATRSTLEAIELSQRPIALTHANPHEWHPVPRNKPVEVLKALAETGGMLGFSLYPHHLRDGSACSLDAFCAMIARTAEIMGGGNIGIGSDLCQSQPDEVVQWMRHGKESKEPQTERAVFPPQPEWFRSNRDLASIAVGLTKVGFSQPDVDAIMGENWLRFFDRSFTPSNDIDVGTTTMAPLTVPGRG